MPLQEDSKCSKPFKNVDIKTMFLAAGTRKRKASSPIPSLNEAKNVKICEKEEDDIQVIDDSDTTTICAGETKENRDLNTVKNEEMLSVSSDDFTKSEEIKSPKNNCNVSNEEEMLINSSEDLDSSQLNSSFNALNNSGLSETNPDSKPDILSITKTEVVIEGANDTNKSNVKKKKRMTPEEAKIKAEERDKKQKERLQKKQELELKKLEREREIQQRKFQKEAEKKAKEEEKKEKERLRLEKKEQEEKEKQMRLEEKENQKRIRLMALEQKLEMKKQKEEMKQKQEEERKKAEDEKKKAEQEKELKEKERKERAKAAFVKFFKKENNAPSAPIQKSIEAESVFKPFQVSEDMTLAPYVPLISQERFNKETLDTAMALQSNEHYLQIYKSGSYTDIRYRKKQRKPRLDEADVMIVDGDQPELYLTRKLLQFSENVRPPYAGTWRKKSKNIRPRNPFGKDDIFDYSVDSDEEWEEGEPGESLSGTEPEDESEDDYEVDNEFMVPHGYLSAEEEKIEDENEQDDEVVNDPEKQKDLLKKKFQEFEMERKKKTTELKPIILGYYIENIPSPQNNSLRLLLEPNTAVFLTETPIPTFFSVKKLKNESKPNSNSSSPTSSAGSALKSKKGLVPEEAMHHLIRLVHGNHHSLAFLIPEFQKFWQQHCIPSDQKETLPIVEKPEDKLFVENTNVPESPSADSLISKRQLIKTIRQIASKGLREGAKRSLWMVNEEVLKKYELMDLPIPNLWCYLTVNNKEDAEMSPVVKPVNASIKEFLVP